MKANITNTQELIAAALCPAVTIIEVQPTIGLYLYRARYNEDNDTLEWYEYDNKYMYGRPELVITITEIGEQLQNGSIMAEFDHPIDHMLKIQQEMQHIQNKFHQKQWDMEGTEFYDDAHKAMNKAATDAYFGVASVIEDTLGGRTLHEYSQQEFTNLIQDYLQQVEEDKNLEPTEVQILTEDDLSRALRNGVDVYVAHMKGQMDLYLKDGQIAMWGQILTEDSLNTILDEIGVFASFKLPRKYRKNFTEKRYDRTHRDHCVMEIALLDVCRIY